MCTHRLLRFTSRKTDEAMRDEIARMFAQDVPETRLVGFGMMKEIPGSVQNQLREQPVTRRTSPGIADVAANLSLLAGKILAVSGDIS